MNLTVKTFTDSSGNQLEYGHYGSNSKVLICFPGFGESYKNFEHLSSHLLGYSIFAINLYYIGQSQRQSQATYLTNKEWNKTFSEFLLHAKIDRFSVLGFSLGGRFAAATFSAFHSRMNHLILIAADGVIKRWTYQIATFPVFFRQLFLLLMKYPQPYFLALKILLKLSLVNTYIAKFSLTHLEDKADRMLVYHSWVTFKYLRLTNKKLSLLINSSTCMTTIIFGKKDKIIRSIDHQSFLSQLQNTKALVLPFGHNHLVDNSATIIYQILN